MNLIFNFDNQNIRYLIDNAGRLLLQHDQINICTETLAQQHKTGHDPTEVVKKFRTK